MSAHNSLASRHAANHVSPYEESVAAAAPALLTRGDCEALRQCVRSRRRLVPAFVQCR